METDELELLDKSVRHALTLEADADEALEAIGWSDVLTAEPRDAVSVVFGALGDLNAVASSLDDVMLDGLRVPSSLDGALALPAFRGWDPPGVLRDGSVEIGGLALARVSRRDTVIVPARDGERVVVAAVPTTAVERTVVEGISPEIGIAHLQAAAALPVTIEVLEPEAWDDALVAGRRGARDRARGRGARDAPLRPRAHALAGAVRPPDRPVPGGAPPARRRLRRPGSRRCRRRLGLGRTWPAHRAARQVARRSREPGREHPLPAGARRHRLHDRPSVAPLHQTVHGARRLARIVVRPPAPPRCNPARDCVLAPRVLDL